MSKKKSKDTCYCCPYCNNCIDTDCCNKCCDCCCDNCCCCGNNNNFALGYGLNNGFWEAILFWLIASGSGLLNNNSILIILLFLLYGLSGNGNNCCCCCQVLVKLSGGQIICPPKKCLKTLTQQIMSTYNIINKIGVGGCICQNIDIKIEIESLII